LVQALAQRAAGIGFTQQLSLVLRNCQCIPHSTAAGSSHWPDLFPSAKAETERYHPRKRGITLPTLGYY